MVAVMSSPKAPVDSAEVHQDTTKLDQLRAQLAEAQAEIERLKALATKMDGQLGKRPCQNNRCVNNNALHQQLAASQATNEKLREALGKFRDNVLFRIGSASPYRKVAQEYFEYIAPILALPNDTTALNKLLSVVYEECAKECDRLDYWYSARAIRALAKQKGLTS